MAVSVSTYPNAISSFSEFLGPRHVFRFAVWSRFQGLKLRIAMVRSSTWIATIIVVPKRRSPVGVELVVKDDSIVELRPLQMRAPTAPKETVRKHRNPATTTSRSVPRRHPQNTVPCAWIAGILACHFSSQLSQ